MSSEVNALMANAILDAVPGTAGLRVSMVPGDLDEGRFTGVGMDLDGHVFVHRVGAETIYLTADAADALAALLKTYATIAHAWEGDQVRALA